MSKNSNSKYGTEIKKSMSLLNVWALSFGCAVGWGAFIMPGTTFLPISGPLGTVLGISLSAVIMLIIGINYSFMIKHYPDAGGSYTYARENLGYDHGFLCAWFMAIVYMSIAWANATALPLIFRNLVGNIFQFGFHYQIAGYDVYFGEAILSVISIVIIGFVCSRDSRLIGTILTTCAVIMVIGITIGFIAAVVRISKSGGAFNPPFSPERNSFSSVASIVALAPWAFVGFESVAHATEEFEYSYGDIIKIIISSVLVSAFSYIALSLLAVSVLPDGFSSWYEYIKVLDDFEGFQSVPVFNSVNILLGKYGLILFCFTILGAVITGMLGQWYALSRLSLSVKRHDFMPGWIGRSDGNHMPKNLIPFMVLISIPVPFLGRSVINWIVDISSIGATIAYAYTSLAAFRIAREEKNNSVMATGFLGLLFSIYFCLFMLIPSFTNIAYLSTESYLILVVWSILGFLVFYYINHKDKEWRYGNSTVVWIMLLLLILFTTTVWTRQRYSSSTEEAIHNIMTYQKKSFEEIGHTLGSQEAAKLDQYLQEQLAEVNGTMMVNNSIQIVLVLVVLVILFSLYTSIIRKQKSVVEDLLKTKNDFMSNMSHEIRTPINTILGMDEMILRETKEENSRKYATDIYVAGNMLVSLVNEILDYSSIDAGYLTLEEAEYNLYEIVRGVSDDIFKRAKAKGLIYDVSVDKNMPKRLYGDSIRFRQILNNLLSNAVKYTEEGRITLNISVTKKDEEHVLINASVIDTGVGLDEENRKRIFNSFDRINSGRSITSSGAGLGMNIVKSLLELMGGTLEVESVPDLGSNFTFTVCQKVIDWEPVTIEKHEQIADSEMPTDTLPRFTAPEARILVVDDTEMNLFVIINLLKDTLIQVDTAKDGAEGLEMTTKNEYDLLLIDHRMPIMDGIEMLTTLRGSINNANVHKPCVALTANAGAESKEKYINLGFDYYMAKPVSGKDLEHVIMKFLPRDKIIASKNNFM